MLALNYGIFIKIQIKKWKSKGWKKENMKNRNDFYKRVEKMNKIFCDFMEEKGFSTFTFDDIDLGLGASASNDKDDFVPIFEFQNYPYPESHTIFVEDRNCNSILSGNTVAIYSLS